MNDITLAPKVFTPGRLSPIPRQIAGWITSLGSSRLFLLLIRVDLFFLALHVLRRQTGLFANEMFDLETDRGLSEMFQYTKEALLVLMFLGLAVRWRQSIHLAWAVVFGYLLLDDSLQFHERLGAAFEAWFPDLWVLGPYVDHPGQIPGAALVGLFFITLIGLAYRFSDERTQRISRNLIIMLLFFAFFSVVIDGSIRLFPAPFLRGVAATLEEAGEMFVMSAICWYVYTVLRRRTDLPVISAPANDAQELSRKG